MKTTVAFSSLLSAYVHESSFEMETTSFRDIVGAVYNLFPRLKQIRNAKLLFVEGDKVIRETDLDFKPKKGLVQVVPSIGGNSSFDSLGNLTQFYGSSTALSNQEIAFTGLNRRILESSLFGQAQTAFDTAQRKATNGTSDSTGDPTTSFGDLSLTKLSGQFVPLHFGLVRTSGAIINQYIKHIQRGSIDDVQVSKYV